MKKRNNWLSYPGKLLAKLHLKSRLKRKDFTIIASDCIGGVIYHDLFHAFSSPTINLQFDDEDFLLFVEHLADFTATPLVEETSFKEESLRPSYPVGKLVTHWGCVRVYFVHYPTFEQAKAKWEERCQRISWEHLYILMESQSLSPALLSRFAQLPYPHKCLITNENSANHSFVFSMHGFYDNHYFHGKILEYPPHSSHRYLEAFDYVHFINTGEVRATCTAHACL